MGFSDRKLVGWFLWPLLCNDFLIVFQRSGHELVIHKGKIFPSSVICPKIWSGKSLGSLWVRKNALLLGVMCGQNTSPTGITSMYTTTQILKYNNLSKNVFAKDIIISKDIIVKLLINFFHNVFTNNENWLQLLLDSSPPRNLHNQDGTTQKLSHQTDLRNWAVLDMLQGLLLSSLVKFLAGEFTLVVPHSYFLAWGYSL